MDRIDEELTLLRRFYPDLEYKGEGRWVRFPHFKVPAEPKWSSQVVDVAVQFLPGYPGQKPYAFYVSPPLTLESGVPVKDACASVEPPWPGQWQKFSWDAPEWFATADLRTGSNMLNFVQTFSERLAQGA